MERKVKIGLGVAAAVAALGLFGDMVSDRSAVIDADAKAAAAPPTVAECTAARDGLGKAVAVSPGEIANPRAGVMVMPPFFWSSLDENQRGNLLTMLAVQKGCAENTAATGVEVELRSSADNRLLGSGPAWKFDEAD